MKTLINKITAFVRDPLGTRRMVEDFQRDFPGKCMICSYHRYGLREGFTSEPEPKPHECCEKQETHPAP